MAEYEACTLGIQAEIDFKVKLLKVYGDSALVIHQLRGEWETRDHKLIPYQAYIRKLIEYFDDISFHHIPREENQMADALATLASMFQLTPHGDLPYIEFRCLGKPAHCCLTEEEQDGKPWYFDIKRYIEDKEYPWKASDNDKRTLRRLATGFFLSGNIMYKSDVDIKAQAHDNHQIQAHDPIQDIGGPMTRAKAKKAQEVVEHMVTILRAIQMQGEAQHLEGHKRELLVLCVECLE
ncbi:uncharacterized protein LOC114397138 [Glycine soja]|uniref:uncharacterized protein n=1 Tax=Glycine max TaxID=3847 RepID=UPI0003DEB89A|nr:uncharacterized protein LOC113000194 [Glycine max]XP_028215053.1 uncharacterized protein LOC114397138 [Glycine soja]|eukprot:XP_025982656.1 uncharacterized protein LOC113000194 [Glycine max]